MGTAKSGRAEYFLTMSGNVLKSEREDLSFQARQGHKTS